MAICHIAESDDGMIYDDMIHDHANYMTSHGQEIEFIVMVI